MNHVLKLDRPFAVLDLETTGTAPEMDRIIKKAILLVYPDGKGIKYCRRVNPEIAIPPEATNVHGIRDEDVRGKPTQFWGSLQDEASTPRHPKESTLGSETGLGVPGSSMWFNPFRF